MGLYGNFTKINTDFISKALPLSKNVFGFFKHWSGMWFRLRRKNLLLYPFYVRYVFSGMGKNVRSKWVNYVQTGWNLKKYKKNKINSRLNFNALYSFEDCKFIPSKECKKRRRKMYLMVQRITLTARKKRVPMVFYS